MGYPTSIDSPDTSMQGTSLFTGDDHSLQHRTVGSAVIAIEQKLGLGNGSAAANQILVGSGAGTAVWGSVWNNATLGTPAITGGTANSIFLGTPTFSANAIVGTTIADAAATSRKVQLQYFQTKLSSNFVQTTSSTTWYNVTNLAGTINPPTNAVLFVSLMAIVATNATNGRWDLRLLLNGATEIGYTLGFTAVANDYIPAPITFITTVNAGLGTIQVQLSDQSAGNNQITFAGGAQNLGILQGFYWSQ